MAEDRTQCLSAVSTVMNFPVLSNWGRWGGGGIF